MRMDQAALFREFAEQDRQQGQEDYRTYQVRGFHASNRKGRIKAECSFYRQQFCETTIRINGSQLEGSCTCLRYLEGHPCRHMAALLYQTLEWEQLRSGTPGRVASDSGALQLLRSYRTATRLPTAPPAPIRLQPILDLQPEDYPTFRFKVGWDRMYVVKSLPKFLRDVHQRNTVTYGKNLTFCHALENFTPEARQWIQLLSDACDWEEPESWYGGYVPAGDKEVCFQGESFDRAFTLLLGRTVEEAGGWPLQVCEEDPALTGTLQPEENGAVLSIQEGELTFFGDDYHCYAACGHKLCRCSQEYASHVAPLRYASDELYFSQEDLPALCEFLQSLPQEILELEDPQGLLEDFTPDTCEGGFYLDLDPTYGLTARLELRYGDQRLRLGDRTPEGLRRNEQQELQLLQQLEKRFPHQLPSGLFYEPDENRYLTFLCQELPQLQAVGTVYLSDALQKKRISTTVKPTVGISVSGGLLTLDLDSGEFPPEELEALYQSLLQKKTYHKLKDGRYLPLQDNGYTTLAEIAHMTQLKPEELRAGQVTMPAYRGLYLDRVLDKQEDVSVRRDQSYRQLIRDFKCVEDSDHQLPQGLQATLRPYQTVGFQWMKTLEANGFGGILADEMGLGKTVQVLTFLLTVPRETVGCPSLIVCPASLVLNWADELERFAPSLKALVLAGGLKERKEQLKQADAADVLITSYDLLKRDIALYQERAFYCCVLDEGQTIKNQTTQVSKAVKKINCRQRFVLTGTPIENRLSELWNLFDFLMPGYLFTHNTFVEKLEKPIVRSENADARRQLNLLVQPFLLRRLKTQVLKELPPKIEHVRRIGLSTGERKLYQAEMLEARRTAEQTQQAVQMLALLTRLRQTCCDPALLFENYQGDSSKLAACLELCGSLVTNGHQILLFSQFTTMLDRLRERLEAAGISTFTLVGATPKRKRAQLVRDFNQGKASVFLISLKAGGTGLNLTGADVVIHYDPWWNLAVQEQATDRAHRIGQTNTVEVYKLIAQNTIEEKILRLQERKASLMELFSGDSGSMPLNREEILALLED